MIQNPQPIPGLPDRVQAAIDELRAGPQAIHQLLMTYRRTVDEQSLAVSHDAHLSAEGKAARIQQIKEAAAQRAGTELEALRGSLDTAQQVARRNLERRWPSPQPGLEGLLTRQAAWARYRPLLENGTAPADLIAEITDVETLFALREELPLWLRANSDKLNARPLSTHVIDQRIAELVGDFASANLEGALQADAERAYCEPLLQNAAAQVGTLQNQSDLGSAMTARMNAEAARARVLDGGTTA